MLLADRLFPQCAELRVDRFWRANFDLLRQRLLGRCLIAQVRLIDSAGELNTLQSHSPASRNHLGHLTRCGGRQAHRRARRLPQPGLAHKAAQGRVGDGDRQQVLDAGEL
jgi:hypothetical protein